MADLSRIGYLLSKYARKELTPEEKTELEAWIAQSENNKSFVDSYVHSGQYIKEFELMLNLPYDKMDQRFYKMLDELYPDPDIWTMPKINVWRKIRKNLPFPNRPFWVNAIGLTVLVSIILLTTFAITHRHRSESIDKPSDYQSASSIPHKDTTANIVFNTSHSGMIRFDSLPSGSFLNAKGWIIRKSKTDLLSYTPGPAAKFPNKGTDKNPETHSITVPENSSPLNVSLPSGIKLIVMRGSRISYTIWQAGTSVEKVIFEMNGDISYDIPPNMSRHCLIKGSKSNISVIGTAFSIQDFANRDQASLKMIRGKVKFSNGTDEKIVKEGQEAIIDRNSPTIVVNTDTTLLRQQLFDNTTHLGYFDFRKQNLRQSLIEVSNWYNLDAPVFDNDIDTLTLGKAGNGLIPKDGEYLIDLLQIIKTNSNYHLIIKNNHIMITK